MSEIIIETSNFDTTVTVPTDGDTRNAASVKTAFQSLANRTKYLLDLINGSIPGLAVSPVTRQVPLTGLSGSPHWSFVGQFGIQCDDASSGWSTSIDCGCAVPFTGKIYSFSYLCKGASGHTGLPGNRPSVALYQVDTSSLSSPAVLIATATEAAATVSGYESWHLVGAAPASPVVVAGVSRFYVVVTGEYGANALPGFSIGSIRLSVGS